MKIIHITTIHPRYDTRIFLKQCRSLAKAGYRVSLVVADGKGDERKDGIAIYDVGSSRGRISRILKTTGRVYAKAKELDADLYHLHDPELIPAGLKLKDMGKKVIFDSQKNQKSRPDHRGVKKCQKSCESHRIWTKAKRVYDISGHTAGCAYLQKGRL
jgi:hypothetical protein